MSEASRCVDKELDCVPKICGKRFLAIKKFKPILFKSLDGWLGFQTKRESYSPYITPYSIVILTFLKMKKVEEKKKASFP